MKNYDIATRTIHAGQEPDPSTGAIMTPIYATSTYVQESPGKHKGFDYSRSINPTRLAYEKCIAYLESGTRGWAFPPGSWLSPLVLMPSRAARTLSQATIFTVEHSGFSKKSGAAPP